MFESALTASAGLLTMGIAFACWRFGGTPAARAVFIPLLAVGLLLASAGVWGYLSNQRRLVEFEQAFHESQAAFVQAEKERVEGFDSLYTFTLVLAPTCFVLATVLFWWTLNPHWRAVGIALVLIGLSGLVIDYFAQERADTYYEAIRAELAASTGARPPSGTNRGAQ